jgi:hypothetical protein
LRALALGLIPCQQVHTVDSAETVAYMLQEQAAWGAQLARSVGVERKPPETLMTETLAVFSIHGRAKLLEYTGMLGLGRTLRPFLTKLSAHVRIAIGARRRTKALHLRDEMREHARLHETGVLTKLEYEACKGRILVAHSPRGASSN